MTQLSDGTVTSRMYLVTPSCVHISQWGPIFVLQRVPPLMWIPALKLHSTFPMMHVFFFFFQSMLKYITFLPSFQALKLWILRECLCECGWMHTVVIIQGCCMRKNPFHCCQAAKQIISSRSSGVHF